FTSPADAAASSIDVVLSGAVRGFGIDDVSITGGDGAELVPNGSFEAVQTPSGIVNDSLVMTGESALLAVSLPEGPVSWTATSTAGGEPITGESAVAGALAALPLTGVSQGHYEVSVNDASGRQIQTAVAIIDTDGFSIAQDGRFGV
ncbi:hypothetical protein HER21_33790, partial [Pseudomonas sp. BGM005]|nr:hypothetical protein [Pseudomonas sp. BG5]